MNSSRRGTARRRSLVECLESRLLLTASYVPAYVLEAPIDGLAGVNNSYNFPTFGDVDADGDLDLLMGQYGRLAYFQNIGNSSTPVFEEQAGFSDPFAGVTASLQAEFGLYSLPNPELADWDADGDLDLALGLSSSIRAFENAGTAMTPDFVSLTGDSNPFGEVSLYAIFNLSIAFGDLDGDHDLDAVLSTDFQVTLNYLENQNGVFVPEHFTVGELDLCCLHVSDNV